MSTKPLYCRTCKKYVAMEGRVGDYRCPTCQNPVKIGDGPMGMSHREAKRDEVNIEISLRESFEAMGLSETAAKIAAQGRGVAEVPGDLDKLESLTEGKLRGSEDGDNIVRAAVSQLLLEETFIDSGMSEIQARAAARGRDGLGDAVMDVFRNARQILKSTENLEEASLEDYFKATGLSETAAKHAAKGRN